MRFIYFDLGNVLVHFDHRIACEQMAAVANLTPSEVWRVVYESDLAYRYERGEVSSREFHDAFCAATSTRPAFADLYHASADMFEPHEEMVKLVHGLQRQELPLGILSNTCESHWTYCLRNYPWLSKLFGVHALSFRIRSMKPEPTIYQEAAALAETSPSDIFFTDDRPENVAGAQAAGFDAVLFQSPSQIEAELARRGISPRHVNTQAEMEPKPSVSRGRCEMEKGFHSWE
jgi:glucose-1-phosphatase